MNKGEALSHMARTLGLNRETVKDLMKNGWKFEQKNGTATFNKELSQ
jgi:hypothetical protein